MNGQLRTKTPNIDFEKEQIISNINQLYRQHFSCGELYYVLEQIEKICRSSASD